VIEVEGVARSYEAAKVADLTLLVVDQSRQWPADEGWIFGHPNIKRQLLIASKADLPAAWRREDAILIAAPLGVGLEKLRARIRSALEVETLSDRPAITNVRHIALVEQAEANLIRARQAAAAVQALPEEFVLADLQDARAALEEVTGKRTTDDLLEHIFSRFCIGK
jgi:tRNA modification GTPase